MPTYAMDPPGGCFKRTQRSSLLTVYFLLSNVMLVFFLGCHERNFNELNNKNKEKNRISENTVCFTVILQYKKIEHFFFKSWDLFLIVP